MRSNIVAPLALLCLPLAACALPTTAIVDGKEVPRQTLKLTGDPYSITHLAAHPRPSRGVEDHGGRITGPVCGNDVDYEVRHKGDHIELNGYIDTTITSFLEIKDEGGARHISGSFGVTAGAAVVDIKLNGGAVVGRVGFREFQLQQEGDALVGELRIGTNIRVHTELQGRNEMWAMPAADQAVILVNMLTCKGEWLRRDRSRTLVTRFGGPPGFAPRNSSSLYEFPSQSTPGRAPAHAWHPTPEQQPLNN